MQQRIWRFEAKILIQKELAFPASSKEIGAKVYNLEFVTCTLTIVFLDLELDV